MRLFALISALFSLLAAAIAVLCLFAGSKAGFLDDADIMTMTISAAGQTQLQNGTSDDGSSLGSQLDSLTAQTGVHDWFALHVMNYCKGSNNGSESCTQTEPFFSFDTISTINSEIKQSFNLSSRGLDVGVSISTSGWPSGITDVSGKVVAAYKAMFFMLCVGIAAAAIEALASLLVVVIDRKPFGHGKMISFLNFVLSLVSFLGLGLASGIITGTMVIFVNTINSQGGDIGLSATQGNKFLCMIWASTIFMFLTVILWVADFLAERRNRRRMGNYVNNGNYGNYNGEVTLLEDLKNQKKALKMEEKLMKKRMALERKISEGQHYKQQRGEIREASLERLPSNVSTHALSRERSPNGSIRTFQSRDPYDDIYQPEEAHSRPSISSNSYRSDFSHSRPPTRQASKASYRSEMNRGLSPVPEMGDNTSISPSMSISPPPSRRAFCNIHPPELLHNRAPVQQAEFV